MAGGSARICRTEKGYLVMRHMRSYTARHNKIYPLKSHSAVVCAALLGMCLAGCGQMGMQVGTDDLKTPTILTGSIQSAADVAYSDLSPEDRKTIAANLDALESDLERGSDLDGLSLPWLNAISGNSGTVSEIMPSAFIQTGCLTFKTTANTIAGIKLYSGTACRDITQKFAVTALAVADA
jgi:hypothetical protein